jgi:hypothetical protein
MSPSRTPLAGQTTAACALFRPSRMPAVQATQQARKTIKSRPLDEEK